MKNKIVLVGSSMGAWISLKQFKYFKNQIYGFLGIGSAPEFLEYLMWNKFSKKKKIEFELIEPRKRKTVKKSYADNFLK